MVMSSGNSTNYFRVGAMTASSKASVCMTTSDHRARNHRVDERCGGKPSTRSLGVVVSSLVCKTARIIGTNQKQCTTTDTLGPEGVLKMHLGFYASTFEYFLPRLQSILNLSIDSY